MVLYLVIFSETKVIPKACEPLIFHMLFHLHCHHYLSSRAGELG